MGIAGLSEFAGGAGSGQATAQFLEKGPKPITAEASGAIAGEGVAAGFTITTTTVLKEVAGAVNSGIEAAAEVTGQVKQGIQNTIDDSLRRDQR